MLATSSLAILDGAAGRAAVSSLPLPVPSSWRRNSSRSSVKLRVSSGRMTLPVLPSLAGYSQSMSIPSNTPAPLPGPPAPSAVGRLPRI